jgi:hypothetical protein
VVRIRVLVVDDHRIFAESLAAALAAEPDVDVSAAGSGPAALRCMERANAEGRRFDVLLVDADLGGNVPGVRPAVPVQDGQRGRAGRRHLPGRGVRSGQPSVRMVVLAEKDDPRGRRWPCRPGPRAGSPRTARCPGCSPSSGGAARRDASAARPAHRRPARADGRAQAPHRERAAGGVPHAAGAGSAALHGRRAGAQGGRRAAVPLPAHSPYAHAERAGQAGRPLHPRGGGARPAGRGRARST